VTFASRRFGALCLSIVLAAGLIWLAMAYDLTLRDASYLTGWLLFGGVVLASTFNMRKKLPFLPLLNASIWLQIHIYIGWLLVVLFFLHTSLEWPLGWFEGVLWFLFVLVSLSGLIGLFLSRSLPVRIQNHGERLIFERIPQFRAELADEVEVLATRSVRETASNTIALYYVNRLQAYFSGPKNLVAHLLESRAALTKHRREIDSLERYLQEDGREILANIKDLIVAKDNLDYQYSLQLVLRLWLFVHIPLTYALLLVALVHIVLTYAFSGATL